MNIKRSLIWLIRLILLTILYYPIWILGSLAVNDLVPDGYSEPGLVTPEVGLLILGFINTLLIIALIMSSKWYGWKLALILAFSYYGSFTFMTQIESVYFLADSRIPSELLPRLFVMGLSIPLLYIPLAVLICGKWKKGDSTVQKTKLNMPFKQLTVKLVIIAIVYLIIYWLAGYFIAWQNPDLREYYGSTGALKPFLAHTVGTFIETPSIILLQLTRGVLFALIAASIIYGSKLKQWQTGLLVASLLSIPHLNHIMPNSLMPIASVRYSHMIETFSSTFIFGIFLVWLLHRRLSTFRPKTFK